MDSGLLFKWEIVQLFEGYIRFHISNFTTELSIEIDLLILDLRPGD